MPLWNWFQPVVELITSSRHDSQLYFETWFMRHLWGNNRTSVLMYTSFFFARCNPGLRSWLDQKVLIGSKGHLHSMYHLLGKKTDFLLLSHCSNIEEIWNHHSFKDYGSKTNIMYLTDFWICNLMTTYGDHQYIRSTKGLGWWI